MMIRFTSSYVFIVKIVSSIPARGEVYSIQPHMRRFVGELW